MRPERRTEYEHALVNHANSLRQRPLAIADSTGRRNSLMKSFSWRFVVQCFSRAFVESPSDSVEFGLRKYG